MVFICEVLVVWIKNNNFVIQNKDFLVKSIKLIVCITFLSYIAFLNQQIISMLFKWITYIFSFTYCTWFSNDIFVMLKAKFECAFNPQAFFIRKLESSSICKCFSVIFCILNISNKSDISWTSIENDWCFSTICCLCSALFLNKYKIFTLGFKNTLLMGD